jgi:hypothetical protein
LEIHCMGAASAGRRAPSVTAHILDDYLLPRWDENFAVEAYAKHGACASSVLGKAEAPPQPISPITGEVSGVSRRKLSKVLKIMVGPCGLEPQTSTVSKRRDYVLPITYNASGAV